MSKGKQFISLLMTLTIVFSMFFSMHTEAAPNSKQDTSQTTSSAGGKGSKKKVTDSPVAEEPAPAPTPTETSTETAPSAPTDPIPTPEQVTTETFSYTVKSGDTLYLIAKTYNTTVETIKTLNNLITDMIYVGQVLLIPITNVQSQEVVNTKPLILGYYTKYWSNDLTSYQSLTENYDMINSIATASLDVNADGTIAGYLPTEAVSFSNQNNITTYATIQNRFDPALTNIILSNQVLRQTVIQNMLKLVQDNQYKGINIDFENMYAADRALFNQFLSEVSQVFRAQNLPMMVSVPAKTGDFPTWAWSGTFDYNYIGQVADYVQIMTYDQHGQWGEPGPVSGLNWVENVLSFARTSSIPSNKILIGLPAYGYDWNVTLGSGHKAVTYKQIKALIAAQQPVIKFDTTSQSPYFNYVDSNGNSHVVWFENNESIIAKTNLVSKYGLAGVSVWRMGQEDRTFWESIYSVLGR
ncbi:glycosyl hydrolase family 18 protein [Robertmurraya sp. P23]|uniref:glycosyl hydrolase family 18 protein n=1 Tax=Robertmurraya sp. P23 TaxID=3436931 RepID=UPI003D99C0C8